MQCGSVRAVCQESGHSYLQARLRQLHDRVDQVVEVRGLHALHPSGIRRQAVAWFPTGTDSRALLAENLSEYRRYLSPQRGILEVVMYRMSSSLSSSATAQPGAGSTPTCEDGQLDALARRTSRPPRSRLRVRAARLALGTADDPGASPAFACSRRSHCRGQCSAESAGTAVTNGELCGTFHSSSPTINAVSSHMAPS